MANWGNIGNAIKTGVQNFGNVVKSKGTGTLPNIDNLTFDTENKPVKNIDALSFDPNNAQNIDIDNLTFEDKLSGKQPFNKTGLDGLANALSGLGGNQPAYKFSPSMVDYSQYMGLSPETQKYLYGGL